MCTLNLKKKLANTLPILQRNECRLWIGAVVAHRAEMKENKGKKKKINKVMLYGMCLLTLIQYRFVVLHSEICRGKNIQIQNMFTNYNILKLDFSPNLLPNCDTKIAA